MFRLPLLCALALLTILEASLRAQTLYGSVVGLVDDS